MGAEKKHRHHHDHDHRNAEDRPASTDIADVVQNDSAQDASAHQRHAATAGPSEDDRFGAGPVASDLKARIISVDIVAGGTRITIGSGPDQGVHVGMEGYVKAHDGMLADFQIDEAHGRVSRAIVDTTPDALHAAGGEVIVNPTSKPKSSEPKQDVNARVMDYRIDGEGTKILIGLGASHGARPGMRGYLVGFGGKPFAVFTLEEVHPGFSAAHIHHTLDATREHSAAVINPSSIPGEPAAAAPAAAEQKHHHGHGHH